MKEVEKKVILVGKVERGGSGEWFGMEVGKMGGMGKWIVKGGEEILEEVEGEKGEEGI